MSIGVYIWGIWIGEETRKINDLGCECPKIHLWDTQTYLVKDDGLLLLLHSGCSSGEFKRPLLVGCRPLTAIRCVFSLVRFTEYTGQVHS